MQNEEDVDGPILINNIYRKQSKIKTRSGEGNILDLNFKVHEFQRNMEVTLSLENHNNGDPDNCLREPENEHLSGIHNIVHPVKAEDRKQNDVTALWVKWRGRWQPGIQCSSDDCPSETLRAKPTYERKQYIVVYFPHTRSHCWADSQLVCPITETPEPLAYGTHASGFEIVKDLCIPRRYMMQTLAVAMLDVSDQLHIEAVVESARDVNAWREFAREAGHCKNYSDLGRMLVKLHSMILEVYINPTWMKNSFYLWKQQCENAQNADTTDRLMKELVNSVLWDDVAKLWDAPVQPNLGSDWKTWKRECMKWFSISNPLPVPGFEGENEKTAHFEDMDISKSELSRKRPKLEIRRGETRSSEIADVQGSEPQAHMQMVDSFISNQQELSTSSQGLSFCSVEGLTNSSTEDVAQVKMWNKVGDDGGYQTIPCSSGYQTPMMEYKLSTKDHLMGSSSEHKHRQCSAFIETKGRQCSRWAKDGGSYCCMHLNFDSPDNAHRVDQVGSLSKSSICQGMTIYGRRCTHRCKNGSSFCLKHLLQDGQIPDSDRTPSSNTSVNSKKRVRLSVEGQHFDKNQPLDTPIQDLDAISERSAQRSSSDGSTIRRHQQFESQSQDFVVQEKSSAKGPHQSVNWSRCIGWCRNNSGQCSHRAKPGSSYCEKHLPSSVGHGGKISDRHISSEILNRLLRNTSSEKDRIHLCRATDLLREFMNVCLLEGTAYRSNSKARILDWIIEEVSKDPKAAEALLAIVSCEKEKLGKHLGIEEGQNSFTAIVPWVPEIKAEFPVDASIDDGRLKANRENGTLDHGIVGNCAAHDGQMLRCKLCGEEFSDSQALGRHWIMNHKKEAQCFFRGYACRMCKDPFTNKRDLERHVKIHHAESLLECCILLSCIHCGSHFMDYEQLWEHVVSAHSEEFIRSVGILEQADGSKALVPVEAEDGLRNDTSACGNSKQEVSSSLGLLNRAFSHNGSTVKGKGIVNRNTVRRYTCRFCGLKFHLLPDLGRHHQAEHMGTSSNKTSISKKGKEFLSVKWRSNKVNSKLTQKVGSSIGLKHAALIARKKCAEKNDLHDSINMNGYSEIPELSEKNGRSTESYCSAVAEMLLIEVQKTRPCPSNQELLNIARSACCKFNLCAVLEEKYGPLPERVYIKAARLCSEANIRVEWHRAGFVCPKQCKHMEDPKHGIMLTPLPDVCFSSLPAQLDDLKMVASENGNVLCLSFHLQQVSELGRLVKMASEVLAQGSALLEKSLIALLVVVVGAVLVNKLRGRKLKLPPGPFALPIFGNWLQVGDDLNHRNLSDLAKKYGKIFLLKMGQRNLVVVSSPDLAKEVLHTQGVEFGSRTRNVVFDIFTGKGQDMVFTVYGDHWRKMRRIMTVPFFTNKVVQHYRFAWEDEISRVVADVKSRAESSTSGIVIRRRLQLMMYNIMYRMMFDRRFESEDDPLFLKLKALNGERSRLAQSFEYNYGDFIPILRPFLRGYLRICNEIKEKRLSLFKDYFVEERKKLASTKTSTNSGELKCAMDHILDAQSKGEINEDNVLYIVENINVAAIETTLWSMEWGIAELVNHQEIQSKVRAELDAVLGPGVQITEPDTTRLPYLQAVVKETLRLRMAIPLLVPHMNLHDAKLGGYDIPAESKILVNAWWLANNPDNWKNPEEFRPERFFEEEKHTEANGNDFKFLPFGVGRRSCPGIILALPLLALSIGRLVQNFHLLPPPGQSKVDVSEKGGQFSLHILNHSLIVAKPIASA